MHTIPDNLLIFIDGKNKTSEIKRFDISKHNVRFVFSLNNKVYTYSRDRVKFKKNVLKSEKAQNIKQYFEKLSLNSPIKIEDSDTSILNNYFNKIECILEDEEVLSYYLEKKPLNIINIDENSLIFPFGINLSQQGAVRNAFLSRISIIQGPPGTGKTQTILNIIANAILNKKSIVIASNNNSAILNVQEKLKKYNLDFLVAVLGSKKNKENFVLSQTEYPEFSCSELSTKQIKDEIKKQKEKINSVLEQQNRLAKLETEYTQYSTEYKHFKENLPENEIDIDLKTKLTKKNSKLLFSLWAYFLNFGDNDLRFKDKFFFWIKFGWECLFLLKKRLRNNIKTIQDCFYSNKLRESEREIIEIKNFLKEQKLSDNISRLSDFSLKLLNKSLFKRIHNKKRKHFSIHDTYSVSSAFVEEYPIVLSTLFSLKNICNNGFVFDYLIVDEASQADLLTSFIAMSCARNIIVVGDLKQLPNVITNDVKDYSENLLKKYPKISEEYWFHSNSLLSSITNLYPDAPSVLLKEHYRCHPKIIGYCNKQFYNDELLPMTQDSQDSDVLKVIQTVKGNHARGHINERQIEVIKQEVLPFLEKDYSIGVISPYRDQVTALQKVLAQAVEVDTIHKFQGREKDIIIFSTVDNDVSPFIDNPNLINVAVSRAVKKFWLVCSNNETDKNDQIQNLIKYIKYNNFEVTESKIHSIFDLLYKQYTKEREEFLAKHKKVSIYVSENLAYVCIKKCLSDIGVLTIDFVIHVPLLDFVKITDEFTDEEIRFIRTDAHVDFLIYNKMDKKPILAIEVDGFKYHKQNFKQINRDQIKNIILEKIGLPLLRLSTTGANEEERIKSKINEIIK
ncbi:MAG: AAA domain-containing protein [Alphaproteobacteria bacterium]|jgi:hypothetical protein|nr:DUF2726 domain-containing protein [Azospirillum sp.]CDB53947.1 putative uncharacterized protein [Azospirillum sp. CAG:239]